MNAPRRTWTPKHYIQCEIDVPGQSKCRMTALSLSLGCVYWTFWYFLSFCEDFLRWSFGKWWGPKTVLYFYQVLEYKRLLICQDPTSQESLVAAFVQEATGRQLQENCLWVVRVRSCFQFEASNDIKGYQEVKYSRCSWVVSPKTVFYLLLYKDLQREIRTAFLRSWFEKVLQIYRNVRAVPSCQVHLSSGFTSFSGALLHGHPRHFLSLWRNLGIDWLAGAQFPGFCQKVLDENLWG